MDEIDSIIDNYKNTAIAVFNFITSIPKPLSLFVFKRIIDESYDIARIISHEEARQQLIYAMCEYFNMEEKIDPICQYLDINKYYKEIDGLIEDKELLMSKLSSICNWGNLPPLEELVHAYSCYSISNLGNDWITNVDTAICYKLKNLVENNGIDYLNNENKYLEFDNCFLRLGYQMLFQNWYSNQSSSCDDTLFINWYCKGEIMDVILYTIFDCNNSITSIALMEFLKKECKRNEYLAEVTQNRYDKLRQIKPQLGMLCFEYEGEKKKNKTKSVYYLSLGSIPKSKVDRNPISDDLMYKLYDCLEGEGYLECGLEAFKNIFSDKHLRVKPIVWKEDVKSLANFLSILRAEESERNKEYSMKAGNLFVQKSGKPCKWKSIYQTDSQHKSYKLFREIFRTSGINR